MLLLCRVLLQRRLTWSAIVLAVVWVGDRSQQETLYARMEGLCLLCLAVGFSGLLSTRRGSSAAAGAVLVAGCGFQPVALFFVAAGGMWAMARGRRAAVQYAVGAVLAAVGIAIAFGPDPVAAAEQFRWHAELYAANQSSLPNNVVRLFGVLKWSAYWAVAVAVVSAGLTVSVVRHRWLVGACPVAHLSAVFAVSGLLGFVVLAKCAFPYTLVVLSVWPVIAVGTALESRITGERAWFSGAAILLLAAWLPSAAWNAMRTRELVLWAGQMDPEPSRRALRDAIPEGRTVGVDKYVGLYGWSLERPVLLLPWHQESQHPPADMWLLVSEVEYRSHVQVAAEALVRRPILREIDRSARSTRN